MVALLAARDLQLRYWNGIEALRGVSLELGDGELVAIIGPNGAGKSSLLQTLAGLRILTAGHIEIRGASLAGLSTRARAQHISLVPQRPIVPDGLAVCDLVLMARYPHLRALAGPGRTDRELVEYCLEGVGFGGQGERLFGELSGGERQRVLLARCLAQETPVILLDEPTSSLDPGHKLAVLDRIRALLSAGDRAVLWVTHDLNLASQFADRMVLIHEGRVLAAGTPDDVLLPGVLAGPYGESFVFGRLASAAAGEERPWALPWASP